MTILDKDIIRESTVRYDEREIIITLGADQRIEFKLKGMKSGVLSVGVEELYKQLRGEIVPKTTGSVSIKKKEIDSADPMINLNRLRSLNAIAHMDLKTKVVLEGLICELLKQEIQL